MTSSCTQNSSGSLYTIPTRPSDERIAQLEAMSYAAYLKTPEWSARREWALWADNYRCRVCYRDKALNVHHRHYCRRGTETLNELTTLCSHCHEMFHKNSTLHGQSKPVLRVRRQKPQKISKNERRRRSRKLQADKFYSKHCVKCKESGFVIRATMHMKGSLPVCKDCWLRANGKPVLGDELQRMDRAFTDTTAASFYDGEGDDPLAPNPFYVKEERAVYT